MLEEKKTGRHHWNGAAIAEQAGKGACALRWPSVPSPRSPWSKKNPAAKSMPGGF